MVFWIRNPIQKWFFVFAIQFKNSLRLIQILLDKQDFGD